MGGQRERDKQRTRDRISERATALFLERGFDEVTVAEVAAAAGVSKVTVFAHFPRKEDLLLDRGPETAALVQAAVFDRRAGVDVVTALRELAVRLAKQRHPLSGLRPGTDPFVRAVSSSPALLLRARELLNELEQTLAAALAQDRDPVADPQLLAALVIAAYRVVVTETTRQVHAGAPMAKIADGHVRRVNAAFDVLDAAALELDRAAG